MPVQLTCSGCKTTLKVRDDLAGRKVKCPKCASVLTVPDEGQDATEIIPGMDEAVTEGPRPTPAKSKPEKKPSAAIKSRRDDPDDDEEDEPRPRPKKRSRRDDDDDEDDRPRTRGEFKPCPKCGAHGAEKVLWTFWGSFYGPAMFTHVRCPECDYAYNGKTGRSNIIPAVIFFTLPLLAIFGILGFIGYILYSRGALDFIFK
jgi:predicted Zn finger-like uncharacterized protein